MTTFLWIAGWYCAGLLGCWLVREADQLVRGRSVATRGTVVMFCWGGFGGGILLLVAIVLLSVAAAESPNTDDHPFIRWWHTPLRGKGSEKAET